MCKVTRNRLGNSGNVYQGADLKVLCVCSAGLLRSPTLSRILCRDFSRVNPRAVGTADEYALIPVDEVHLNWADLIIAVDLFTKDAVDSLLKIFEISTPIIGLNIPDTFNFGDPELEVLIRDQISTIEILQKFK